MRKMNVLLKDFQPINTWKPDQTGPQWFNGNEVLEPQFLIDQTTNKRYLNESHGVVRFKCFLLTIGTPLVHSIASIATIAYRALKLVTLSYFWTDTHIPFKARLSNAGKDLLRIVAAPLSIIGLELSCIYGLFRPYDGRKLYATIERATYGNYILAPCFQPNPERHALGGNIHEKDVF
jgi:hypothetical protein